MTMSNQALKIILGKFMELNRAGPKAPSYCISPAKLILAGENPHYICSDAVSFLPHRDTPPAWHTTQWLWRSCHLEYHLSCPCPRRRSVLGRWLLFCRWKKRLLGEETWGGATASYCWSIRKGRFLNTGTDHPLISLGREGHLSSLNPLRFTGAAEAVWNPRSVIPHHT